MIFQRVQLSYVVLGLELVYRRLPKVVALAVSVPFNTSRKSPILNITDSFTEGDIYIKYINLGITWRRH